MVRYRHVDDVVAKERDILRFCVFSDSVISENMEFFTLVLGFLSSYFTVISSEFFKLKALISFNVTDVIEVDRLCIDTYRKKNLYVRMFHGYEYCERYGNELDCASACDLNLELVKGRMILIPDLKSILYLLSLGKIYFT